MTQKEVYKKPLISLNEYLNKSRRKTYLKVINWTKTNSDKNEE